MATNFMAAVPELLHQLADRMSIAGLALQMIAHDESTPAELRRQLLDFEPTLLTALDTVHEMHKLAVNGAPCSVSSPPSEPSSPSLAA